MDGNQTRLLRCEQLKRPEAGLTHFVNLNRVQEKNSASGPVCESRLGSKTSPSVLKIPLSKSCIPLIVAGNSTKLKK